MANFAEVLKKIADVGAHAAEVVAEHPEAAEAIAKMVMAAVAASQSKS